MDEDCISDIITVATISTTDLVPMYTPHSQVVLNTHMTTEIIPNPFFSPFLRFQSVWPLAVKLLCMIPLYL